VTNPLEFKYLVRRAWCAGVLLVLACGANPDTDDAAPAPTAPLPTAGLAGQRVSVFPLTLVAAEDSLHWEQRLAPRSASLAQADSVIAELLPGRAPEVTWVPPDELRRAARRGAGIAVAPDQMGTSLLRAPGMTDVPDPLRSQMRTLTALAGTGRYALVPAALVFRKAKAGEGGRGRAEGAASAGLATAELTVVMVDVRLGKVGFQTIARGEGDDPWTALTRAVKALTPGLP